MNALVTMRQVRGAGGEVRHVPTPYVPPAAKKKGRKQHVPDPIKTSGETSAEELRLLIERAERLEEEKKNLADDLADVFAEARSRGYADRTIKAIMKIRKKKREEYQEEEAILETYMQALGMR